MQYPASSRDSGTRLVDTDANTNASGGRFTRAIERVAVVASAAVAGLGLVWLLVPELNPFGNGEMRSLASIAFGPAAAAGIALALGVAGVALAATLLLGRRTARAALGGFGGATLALAMAAGLGSMGIIAFAGYVFGLAAVVAGVVPIAVMLVRTPRLGLLLLAGLIVVIATAVWLAGLTVEGTVEFAVAFGRALTAEVQNLAVAFVIVA